jgi:hypothetical protein
MKVYMPPPKPSTETSLLYRTIFIAVVFSAIIWLLNQRSTPEPYNDCLPDKDFLIPAWCR